MQWQELEPLTPEPCDLASLLDAADIAALHALPQGPAVLVCADVLAAILEHASSSTEETMGLLRGRVLSTNDRVLTFLVQSEPLHAAEGSRTFVHATAASWQAAWPHMHDELAVVGWYHSHPGFGIFFSETDRRSQRNYVSQPWQVGLVIDPSNGEAGAFLGPECARVPMLVIEPAGS